MVRKATYDELKESVKELEKEVEKPKKIQRALNRSARRLGTLLDFVPYPIVVFNPNGQVTYLNPKFTEVFGWTFDELKGKIIPFVPEPLKRKTAKNIKKLFHDKILMDQETKRITKDGRTLDVVIRVSFYEGSKDEPPEMLAIIRDITQERRVSRNNEAILRISMALPEHPNLEELLDYINSEIKKLLNSEGSVVILLDEEKNEFYILGASYDTTDTQKRVKEVRFSMDQLVAGRVIKTGKPIIVSDTSKDISLHRERDKKLGYQTKNLLLVPLRTTNRIIGALCAVNKKEGIFDNTDVDLLDMIAGTVALSIENARVSEDLIKAYTEVTSLNRAKDKVINHLSHELKTPVSILSGSVRILTDTLESLTEKSWKRNIERINRNLDRIVDIQYEVDDIMQDRQYKTHNPFSMLLNQCIDELDILIGEEGGKGEESNIAKRLKNRISEIFGPKEAVLPDEISLSKFVEERLDGLRPLFTHRKIKIISRFGSTPIIFMPSAPLQKVVDGLIKNAIENTPDEGKIEVIVQKKGEGAELVVRDYGVGITEDAQRRIFEGFFTTQDTMAYSSKRPFDFNAGGKGADLLRMKIFSERYNFKVDMKSSRCRFIPNEIDACPGKISKCNFCNNKKDCYNSGGTTFSFFFPLAPERKRPLTEP